MTGAGGAYEPLLFGRSPEEGVVAVEHAERARGADQMIVFSRRGRDTVRREEPFRPFIVAEAEAFSGCPVPVEAARLKGSGRLSLLATFASWVDALKARGWLARKTGATPASPDAPYLFIADSIQQHLTATGRTLFLGMDFADLRRMQVDIECRTSKGYDFCNAEREGDRILAIAIGDQTGSTDVLTAPDGDEAALLRRFVDAVRQKDPDVLEGHNLFNFDLPYLAERARRHGVDLALGRDGSAPRRRPSRLSIGERTIAYDRFEIFGRHVVDTLFMAHAYDVAHRSLDGFGLKEVAAHFGVAAPGRTYLDGDRITQEFERDPARVLQYARDDAIETRGLSEILSPSLFLQTQILPYSFQTCAVRGSAAKIDALMIREYLREGFSLPLPDAPKPFEGGYTDVFMEGVVRNVHHCDIRSLYPSLMLAHRIGPGADELGVFLRLLEVLKTFRLRAKEQARHATSAAERRHLNTLQGTFKVLINSFYGYLGFGQARFSDFGGAERVTAEGRALLKSMIDWLRRRGAQPVEIDTDGIYFVPPRGGGKDGAMAPAETERFRRDFAESLPEGIEIEFDGEFRAMYSYKMKNYALLTDAGDIAIKGAALKSRGLEPFQRSFLRELIRLKLEGREDETPALRGRYERALREREWPIRELAKTERLQDSPATYAAKVGKGRTPRDAAYELALRAGREYRAGDQISYYVTGEKKSVAVHEHAKLVSEWDPGRRDENVAYYLAKLDALCGKFAPADGQTELAL
jgi:DNA polymerase elongation subunit (family B)